MSVHEREHNKGTWPGWNTTSDPRAPFEKSERQFAAVGSVIVAKAGIPNAPLQFFA
jgi:hypothetical protein